MDLWEPAHIRCPYCGEELEMTIDSSAGRQRYVEDCHVCCHPIHMTITVDEDGLPVVEARREDE